MLDPDNLPVLPVIPYTKEELQSMSEDDLTDILVNARRQFIDYLEAYHAELEEAAKQRKDVMDVLWNNPDFFTSEEGQAALSCLDKADRFVAKAQGIWEKIDDLDSTFVQGNSTAAERDAILDDLQHQADRFVKAVINMEKNLILAMGNEIDILKSLNNSLEIEVQKWQG